MSTKKPKWITHPHKLGRGGKYDPIIPHKTKTYTAETLHELPPSSVIGDIENAEAVAREILEKAGFNADSLGVVNMPDGSQCYITGLFKDKVQTREWFAAEILHYARATKQHIESGDAANAVWAARHMQSNLDFLRFSPWEELARIGEKHRKGVRDNIQKYTKEDKAAWRVRAKVLRENPNYQTKAGKPIVSKMAEQIAEETGHGKRSISDYLKSIKP